MKAHFIRSSFARAVVPVLTLMATACSTNPYKEIENEDGSKTAAPYSIESVAEGDFIGPGVLDNEDSGNNGIYRIVLPADQWGTQNDITCVLIKQKIKRVMSCDWVAAHGLDKLVAGQVPAQNFSTAPTAIPVPVPAPKPGG